MSFLVLKLSDGNVLEMDELETHGLATQKAHEYTDDGFPARVVPDTLKEDCLYYFEHIQQKRHNGFIPEYGKVPNGSRAKGEGARPVGNMIFPAFGGMLEGSEGASDQGPQPESLKTPIPLPLSSKRLNIIPKKLESVFKKFQ